MTPSRQRDSSELEEARADHDPERATRISAEIDFLAHELGGALG